MTKFLSLFITVPSYEVAEMIGRTLVEERLVACVNIIASARSIYRWEGRVQTADEVVLIAKGQSDRFGQIEQRVKELHPYECPCIVAWPIAVGHPPYFDWLAYETSAGS
jgi:periplasmic divalent cation tolerance protein